MLAVHGIQSKRLLMTLNVCNNLWFLQTDPKTVMRTKAKQTNKNKMIESLTSENEETLETVKSALKKENITQNVKAVSTKLSTVNDMIQTAIQTIVTENPEEIMAKDKSKEQIDFISDDDNNPSLLIEPKLQFFVCLFV
ncbi:hypothetical protein RFI_07493 [Reticulomyxa filosa]|uniref:Uncharacterized protein n=1 Tax=Reticulomyxa filosa TaxID=46433 RepID=X6NUP2_RETFI|nr:hypothetical protein RFI_07493 [Reticulomyxa filosa]|eukprot:ETO29628.1 hypothetical protein RFI_07493 [Reticulomyxa filosa]